MGFFGLDSTSTATQNTFTADGSGRILHGNRNQYTETGGISVADRSSFNAPGSINLTGAKLGKNTTVTQTVGLSGDSVNALLAQQNNAFSDLLDNLAAQQQQALSNVSDLATSSQTGGESIYQKNLVYVILAVLALVGLIFYLRR